MRSIRVPIILAASSLLLTACHPGSPRLETLSNQRLHRSRAPRLLSTELALDEVGAKAAIHFKHNNGAFGKKWFPETNGSGCAIFDYDGDGWPDLFLVNGRDWTAAERGSSPGITPGPGTTCHLYHNNGRGTFTDVTRGSGLDVPMYGMGAAVGDYDNDGRLDLLVTAVDRLYLFHNDGGGRFTDVTARAGLSTPGWGTSAAWLDYNRDGRLDLFLCHYVRWNPRTDSPCEGSGGARVYCGPNLYAPARCFLFRQDARGMFKDVSKAAGVWGRDGKPFTTKGMGVAVCDVDQDGWPDIVVSNDTEPNQFFRNNRDGTFSERGLAAGIAFGPDGEARSGMGIDTADWDGSGRSSILIGDFVDEMLALFHSEPGGYFDDRSLQTGIGAVSRSFTTFGCLFVDLNEDGWPDIATANGHIDEHTQGAPVALRQRPLFFLNQQGRGFREAYLFDRVLIGRGLASGDFDRDGAPDLVITNNGGAPAVLHNRSPVGNSLRVALEGVRSPRCGIGAEIIARVGSRTIHLPIRSGSSYLSASELTATVGLGKANSTEDVRVRWPAGTTDDLGRLSAGTEYSVVEGRGVAASIPLHPSWRY